MTISRRRFLGFTAGAAAGAAFGVATGRELASRIATGDTAYVPPEGSEDFTLSVCTLCPGGCGVRVRRIDGRPVKVDGNPLHPISGGRLCPKGQAAMQSFYHPDRVPGPLRRREGDRRISLEAFEPATWDDALATIGGRLTELRQAGRPESLALLRGPSRGLGARVAQRFLQAFGSPNDVRFDRAEEAAALASLLGQGLRTAPAYDLQATDYVLSFGSALLEATSSPVYTTRAYGQFRQGRPGRRGKLVHVDTRLSPTAAAADEWISVHPGSEGIFALGVAQVLVAENLYNLDFALERIAGLTEAMGSGDERRESLRSLLAREFPLERVAAVTGVSTNTILRIAREFAAARSQVAIGPRRGPLLPGTVPEHLAVQTLNALMGSIDAPGGVLMPDEVAPAPWPELAGDAVAEAGRQRPRLDGAAPEGGFSAASDPEVLAEAVLRGAPYPLEVLLLLEADPAFASMSPQRFAEALEKIPLVVSLTSLPDDTALAADWILPCSHFLETWDLHTSPPGVPYPTVSLARPAVEASLHDTRPAAEVFLDLAARVGGPVQEALPWKDLQELIRHQVDGLYETRRGAIIGTEFDEAWVRMMERAGWWAPGYRSSRELWQRLQETGGWWDPFYDHGDWKRVLHTPSGRYEMRTDILRLLAAGGETAGEPESSLVLLLFEPLAVAGGFGAELPFLQELLDAGLSERWETWVELHPETAAPLGVGDRDRVRVSSPQGDLEARARVTERVVPGVAAIPVGLGKLGGGRWAAGIGANPLRLVTPTRDPASGLPDPRTTRVEVERVAHAEHRPMEERS